ncbi:hypothetical protein RUMLAC_02696 [[Ruminococcus] lactaris ATCC 29176]|uniref:Uncharacterized protein n=1 Tax=[Ruminococcus] lactaris ATCC 29176 TaxID=471875 RepID=B5CT73_9FIRM|nr:hypothetical protein RUMLAC_02696 [[Ruminococcus] lactaris ATCC 29176]
MSRSGQMKIDRGGFFNPGTGRDKFFLIRGFSMERFFAIIRGS